MVVMGSGDFTVLEPPPADPFQAPRVSLNRLLPFRRTQTLPSQGHGGRGDACRARPVFSPQEGSSSVACSPIMRTSGLEITWRWRVSSTPRTRSPRSSGRSSGRWAVPTCPLRCQRPMNQILHPDFRSAFEKVADAVLQQPPGQFPGEAGQGRAKGEPGTSLAAHRIPGSVVPAHLPAPDFRIPANWVEGAGLELTGTSQLDFKENPRTRGFPFPSPASSSGCARRRMSACCRCLPGGRPKRLGDRSVRIGGRVPPRDGLESRAAAAVAETAACFSRR